MDLCKENKSQSYNIKLGKRKTSKLHSIFYRYVSCFLAKLFCLGF